MMTTESHLKQGSIGFENKHNSSYRYSKLRGRHGAGISRSQ